MPAAHCKFLVLNLKMEKHMPAARCCLTRKYKMRVTLKGKACWVSKSEQKKGV